MKRSKFYLSNIVYCTKTENLIRLGTSY